MLPPPPHPHSPTNSWLFVPLLRPVIACRPRPWRLGARTCVANHGGMRCVKLCAPLSRFRSFACSRHCTMLQAGTGSRFPAHSSTLPRRIEALPAGADVHLGWVIRRLTGADGYNGRPARSVFATLRRPDSRSCARPSLGHLPRAGTRGHAYIAAADANPILRLTPRPPATRSALGKLPPATLLTLVTTCQRRADAFSRGEWLTLLRDASQPLEASAGRACAPADADVERRAARAEALVHLGELSAASRSLTAGDGATLAELRDPSRRPQESVDALSPEVLAHAPAQACPVPATLLLSCLRSARRGSAAGLSGMTNEHLRLLIDEERDLAVLQPCLLLMLSSRSSCWPLCGLVA